MMIRRGCSGKIDSYTEPSGKVVEFTDETVEQHTDELEPENEKETTEEEKE